MKKINIGYIHDGFDMFSVQDLERIEKAKQQCEKLIVGVYTDEYYERKFGKKPIINCIDRVNIVNAIKLVDVAIAIDGERQLTEEEIKHLGDCLKKEETPKEKKYDIGFIQGTFDMFHIGHYNLLNRAQEFCKTLIVGVNTDRLVEEYKRKKPIVPYEDRIRIVSAIKGVDETIRMEDRNKMKAARDIGFNVLIMGSDWKGTEFYNIIEEELKQIGVDTIYFPYTKGISSTQLRTQIGKDNDGNNVIQR